MKKEKIEQLRETFKKAGYTFTTARAMIIDILSRTNKHLSAEEVYQKIYRKYPSIGLTTVYRTLELLVKLGIATKYDFGDGRGRYELLEKSTEEHHHHLICLECNKIVDYTDFMDEEIKMIEKLEKAFFKKYKFEIKSHQIFFYGICEECRKKLDE